MKYQVRIKDIMSDKPATGLLSTPEEAEKELKRIQEEIINTWAIPDPDAAYIFKNPQF